MKTQWKLAVVLGSLLTTVSVLAQVKCPNGARIEANVTDQTGAVIAGAQVSTQKGERAENAPSGRYLLPCVLLGAVALTVEAQGFQSKTLQVTTHGGQVSQVHVQLVLAAVQTDIQVSDSSGGVDSDRGGGTTVLNTEDVQRLPDDPGDLLQQLQMLAASAGGNPEATTIVVDGFQNASALPPKSSIASIRINPDVFSPEYQKPQWNGGRIEITTKTGADSFHGALFFTDSDGSFNATDPFSVTPTPAGKRRYGFELNGPAIRKKADMSLNLENEISMNLMSSTRYLWIRMETRHR